MREFKTSGSTYRRTVQTTLRASYTNHCRRGLIALLDVLEFRSSNTAHQPVIEALGVIARHAHAGNTTYYPLGESVPGHRGVAGDWEDVVYRLDTRGRRRVVRMAYEVATFQALRDALRIRTPTCRSTSSSAAASTTESCARSTGQRIPAIVEKSSERAAGGTPVRLGRVLEEIPLRGDYA